MTIKLLGSVMMMMTQQKIWDRPQKQTQTQTPMTAKKQPTIRNRREYQTSIFFLKKKPLLYFESFN